MYLSPDTDVVRRGVTMTETDDRRRSPRIGVELALELAADDDAHDVVAWDMNDQGTMVFSRVGYPAGKQVIISNGAGWSTNARVVWSKISLESAISLPRITKSWKVVFTLGLEFSEPQPRFWKQKKQR